jgi:ubiquinone/menaquinone biosynthesis C-methylase UbiE
MNFNEIAERYEKISMIQKSAAEILFNLLDIRLNEAVLDAGCGSGNLSKKIKGMTKAKVFGIDPSSQMIEEAIKSNTDPDIIFEINNAENISYENKFDVIFCNSAFQWFKDPDKAVKNFYNALKNNGRAGIQAPATKEYCPNFIRAIESIKKDDSTKVVFKYFKNPWIFYETEEDYKKIFIKAGFDVPFSKLESITTKNTPDETFTIFSSGAIAGYLNQDYYDINITDEYMSNFKKIIKKEFTKQAGRDNRLDLTFNRIYLIAYKK